MKIGFPGLNFLLLSQKSTKAAPFSNETGAEKLKLFLLKIRKGVFYLVDVAIDVAIDIDIGGCFCVSVLPKHLIGGGFGFDADSPSGCDITPPPANKECKNSEANIFIDWQLVNILF